MQTCCEPKQTGECSACFLVLKHTAFITTKTDKSWPHCFGIQNVSKQIMLITMLIKQPTYNEATLLLCEQHNRLNPKMWTWLCYCPAQRCPDPVLKGYNPARRSILTGRWGFHLVKVFSAWSDWARHLWSRVRTVIFKIYLYTDTSVFEQNPAMFLQEPGTEGYYRYLSWQIRHVLSLLGDDKFPVLFFFGWLLFLTFATNIYNGNIHGCSCVKFFPWPHVFETGGD